MATDPSSPHQFAGDGLNETVWETIAVMAGAARGGDATSFFELAKVLKPHGPTAIVYTRLLLGQTVVRRLEVANPTDQQLRSLVQEASLNLRVLGRFTDNEAELTLRDLFADTASPVADAPAGSAFVLYGIALLGALMQDPATDLASVRPYVVRKCSQLAESKPDSLGFLRGSAP